MATFDLKPLSPETIEEMEFVPSDLWMVKFNHEEFGPFDTKSLKHYALEHDGLFARTLASHVDPKSWQPFFDYPEFKRAEPSHKVGQKYWVLETGHKSHPLYHKDVEKKLEDGTLSMTDQISLDDGHSWQKIYLLESFDQIFHSADELPDSPLAMSLDNSDAYRPDKEQPVVNKAQDDLISMTFSSQQNLKNKAVVLDEALPSQKSTDLSQQIMAWLVPATVALFVIMGMATYNWLSTSKNPQDSVADAAGTSETPSAEAPEVIMPKFEQAQAELPPVEEVKRARRRPASVRQMPRKNRTRDQRNNESSYPTQIETHVSDEPIDSNNDTSLDESPPVETSLADDPSLDAAMNTSRKEEPREEAPVEEPQEGSTEEAPAREQDPAAEPAVVEE